MSKETKRLEGIIERLKKEAEQRDPVKFGNWLADNANLGSDKDGDHFYIAENKYHKCTIDELFKISIGEKEL